MSVISNFMKRFGWVRLSTYGLEVAPDGKLASASQPSTSNEATLDLSWDEIPEAPIDAAGCFDPTLATKAIPTPPPLPMLAPPAARKAQTDNEDKSAWLAAVAKSKSQSAGDEANHQVQSEEPDSEEDWEALMSAARERAEEAANLEAATDIDNEADTEEDWEALMSAARERADSKPRPESLPPVPAPQLDVAAAQVEQGTAAANDDSPLVKLTSVPAADAEPAIADQEDSENQDQEDSEWQRLRAVVEERDQAESERKMRAMREIRRLRGNCGSTKNGRPSPAPPKRRLAAGTMPPPIKGAPKKLAIVIAPDPAKAPAAPQSEPSPASSLPRITQRLTRNN